MTLATMPQISFWVIANTTGNSVPLSSNPESGIVSGTAPLDFTLSLAKTYSSREILVRYDPDNGSIANRGDNETTESRAPDC